MTNVGIVGYGWVGKSMKRLFPDAYVYDVAMKHTTKKELNKCQVAFICVPTPNTGEGRLNMSIIEDVVKWCTCPLLVIRSTLNPGTADYLSSAYKKRILVQPEYLGETANHPMTDQNQFLIIGGEPEHRRELINLYSTVYNANVDIHQVSRLEAEIIKLTENRAIAFKVAQCQELYDVCELQGVDYYTIRDSVYGADPRFNLWWTFVFPDNRGMNSKCIPKDVWAWCAWAESLGYQADITRAILERNKKWLT